MITFISLVECDFCGTIHIEKEDADYFDDIMISPPEGWNADFDVPEEHRHTPTWNIADACPGCKDNPNPDWEVYKKRWQEREDKPL